MTLIYAVARLSIVFVWLWHGLVPKLLFQNADELLMLRAAGLTGTVLPWIGAAEILAAIVGILFWRWRTYFVLTALAMIVALCTVTFRSPAYVWAAFNPVTLNGCVLALSGIGWCASRYTAFAGRCLRRPRKGK